MHQQREVLDHQSAASALVLDNKSGCLDLKGIGAIVVKDGASMTLFSKYLYGFSTTMTMDKEALDRLSNTSMPTLESFPK